MRKLVIAIVLPASVNHDGKILKRTTQINTDTAVLKASTKSDSGDLLKILCTALHLWFFFISLSQYMCLKIVELS